MQTKKGEEGTVTLYVCTVQHVVHVHAHVHVYNNNM